MKDKNNKNTDIIQIEKRKKYMQSYYLKNKVETPHKKNGVVIPHILNIPTILYFD